MPEPTVSEEKRPVRLAAWQLWGLVCLVFVCTEQYTLCCNCRGVTRSCVCAVHVVWVRHRPTCPQGPQVHRPTGPQAHKAHKAHRPTRPTGPEAQRQGNCCCVLTHASYRPSVSTKTQYADGLRGNVCSRPQSCDMRTVMALLTASRLQPQLLTVRELACGYSLRTEHGNTRPLRSRSCVTASP